MAAKKNPLQETVKFALRMLVLALPLLITWLTNSGFVEWAGIASAVLALADKYIHVSPDIASNGLVPF